MASTTSIICEEVAYSLVEGADTAPERPIGPLEVSMKAVQIAATRITDLRHHQAQMPHSARFITHDYKELHDPPAPAPLHRAYTSPELQAREDLEPYIPHAGVGAAFIAAAGDDLLSLQAHITGGLPANCRNAVGDSLLHVAATAAHTRIVSYLLGHGGAPNARNKRGNTGLVLAAKHGRVPVAEALISGGADVNLAGEHGHTPLHVAVLHGHIDIIEYLIHVGAHINAMNVDGDTALICAVSLRLVDAVRVLCLAKANVNACNKEGNTAFMIAAGAGDTALMCSLHACHANVNISNNKGNTALMLAAASGHTNAVILMLSWHATRVTSHGVPVAVAAPVDVKAINDDGETATSIAVTRGYPHIAALIRAAAKRDAPPSPPAVTPVAAVVVKGSEESGSD
jgi:ankyrin repeat protein